MTRVIIVDDDNDILQVISELLKTRGIDVIGTGNDGKQALELYQTLKPDIVVLDMKMPEYDGMYAIEKIKEKDPNAKIIILSGHIDDYDFTKHKDLEILRKAYDFDELTSKIKRFKD